MKRSSGLARRKPWRPGRPPARVATQTEYVARPREVATAAVALPMAAPVVKFAYVRDERIRDACRAMACQHCGSTGGVTWAHSNWACHGKGKAIKASDQYVAALCGWCHASIDQGSALSDLERWCLWYGAHQKTYSLAVAMGLWPRDVLAPNFQLRPGFVLAAESEVAHA